MPPPFFKKILSILWQKGRAGYLNQSRACLANKLHYYIFSLFLDVYDTINIFVVPIVTVLELAWKCSILT